jgi:hypothetical protein
MVACILPVGAGEWATDPVAVVVTVGEDLALMPAKQTQVGLEMDLQIPVVAVAVAVMT